MTSIVLAAPLIGAMVFAAPLSASIARVEPGDGRPARTATAASDAVRIAALQYEC